jgi:hypothetical protein
MCTVLTLDWSREGLSQGKDPWYDCWEAFYTIENSVSFEKCLTYIQFFSKKL